MKTRVIVFLLLAALLSGLFAPMIGAAEEPGEQDDGALLLGAPSASDIEAAKKIVDTAIKGLTELFPDERQATTVMELFSSAFSALSTGASIISAINGGVTFLRLIGVMKDPTQQALLNIREQLSAISDKLNEMDAKIDNIANEMAKYQAKNEYGRRIETAGNYREAFKNFKRDYMEKTLEQHKTEFDSLRVDVMKAWCRNVDDSARNNNGVDNTRVVLMYEMGKEGWIPLHTYANTPPSDFDGRMLVIPAELLPEHLDWNVNTYRDQIVSYLKTSIKEAVSDGRVGIFNAVNFPEFSVIGSPSDELIAEIAYDAFDTIVYRAICGELNKSSSFVKQLIKDYGDYCTHVIEAEHGVDTMIEALYLTHSFEGEIAETIRNFIDGMILETACCNFFVSDVIGMSDGVTDKEAEDFLALTCHTLKELENAKNNALTGHDNYCYLTNSLVYYGEFTLYSSATIETTLDGPADGYHVDGFASCSASGLSSTFSAPGAGTALGRGNLIGDVPVQLLHYTLASNGITPGHKYFNETLGGGFVRDRGMIATTLGNETTLPTNDGSVSLHALKLIGEYFTNGGRYTLAGFPSDASAEYIRHRSKIQGSIYNPATSAVSSSQTLFAMVLYGESHWYWSHDEAAFFGGGANDPSFAYTIDKVCTKNYGVHHYNNNYVQSIAYNALYSVAFRPLQSGGMSPLATYRSLCAEIEEEFPRPVPPEAGESIAPAAFFAIFSLSCCGVCALVYRRRRNCEV